MALTSEMLRDAANLLAPDHAGMWEEFTCHCLTQAIRNQDPLADTIKPVFEYGQILDQQGISGSGDLTDYSTGKSLSQVLDGDVFAIQCWRFDYLQLLACSLES